MLPSLIAVVFLPGAAIHDCPGGWTPSPNSGNCFKVPPERSTSLFRCVDLCNKHGAAPACIGSAEENAFVTAELAVSGGLYECLSLAGSVWCATVWACRKVKHAAANIIFAF